LYADSWRRDFLPARLLRQQDIYQISAWANRREGVGTEFMFAVGVIIPAGPDAFCVWLPAEHGKTIDTYLGFLKEPPTSIAVTLLQFCPADGKNGPHWATPPGEPIHLQLPDGLPHARKAVSLP